MSKEPTPRAADCKVHDAVFHHWSGQDQTHTSMLVFFVPLGPACADPGVPWSWQQPVSSRVHHVQDVWL